MQKNFTNLIQAVARARNHSAALATLLFMLLLANMASAQAVTVYSNTFTSTSDVSRITTSLARGTSSIINGEVRIVGDGGNASNRGYQGYVITAPAIPISPEFTYTVNVKAKNDGSVGTLQIRRGTTAAIAGSTSGNLILGSSAVNNSTYSTFTSNSFFVTTNENLFISFYVEQIGSTGGTIYLDDIEITATCRIFPTAPSAGQVTDAERCGPGSVTLSASGAPAGGSYQWYSVNASGVQTAIANANAATYATPNLSINAVFYVATRSAAGCESETRTPVNATIKAQPLATITTQVNPQCATGSAIVFPLTGTAVNGNPTWSVVSQSNQDMVVALNEDPSAPLSPSVSITGTGTVRVQLSVVSTNGCPANVKFVDLVVTPLPAAPTVTDAERCGPGSVTLSASGAPAGGSYQWYSVNASGVQTAIANANAATYATSNLSSNAVFYVATRSAAGCESETRTPVNATIKAQPLATITTQVNPQCATGSAIVFPLTGTAVNGNPTWSVVSQSNQDMVVALNEDPSAPLSPSVSITGTGTVRVQLSVVSTNGCPANVKFVDLVVTPLPAAPTVTDAERCGPGSVTLSVNNPVLGLTYHWYTTQTSGSPVATTTGTYSPSLTQPTTTFYVTAVNGNCESSGERTPVVATVNPIPVANAGSNKITCSNVPVTIGTPGVAGFSYLWSPATGLSNVNSPQPTVTLTSTSTISVTYSLTVTDNTTNSKCQSAPNSVTVTVNAAPTVSPIGGANSAVCIGSTITLTNTTAGGTWSSSNTNASVNASGVVTGLAAGTAIISYKVTNSNGCENSVTRNITVNSLPPAPTFTGVTANQQVFTGGDNIILQGNPVGGTFTIEDVTTNTATVGIGATGTNGRATFSPCTTGLTEGDKRIIYTVTNANGCKNATSIIVKVIRSTYSVINRANPYPICKGQNTDYTAYVYRDVEIVDVKDSRHPQHAEYSSLPLNDFRRESYYRYWQPDVVRLDGRPATLADPTSVADLVLNPDLFNYDWVRNGQSIQGNKQTTKQAGLSSTDVYYVRATLINQSTFCGGSGAFTTPEEQALVDFDRLNANRKTAAPVAGESNRLWYSSPSTYTFNLTAINPVCIGQQVTFRAAADYGGLALSGLQLYFYKKDAVSGTIVQLNTTPFTTPISEIQLTASSVRNASSTTSFSDGDVISVGWVTDQVKCLTQGEASSILTMQVALPQTMTVANDGVYCAGVPGVALGLQTSQTGISYQLQRIVNNVPSNVGSPVPGTGSAITFGNQLAGNYRVQLVIPTGNCETFGSVTVIETPLPQAFNVTGGGAYCANVTGVSINLSGSEAGISYSLLRTTTAGTTVIRTVTRNTAGAFSFDNVTDAGTYTVRATTVGNTTTATCPRDMTGSLNVSITSLPNLFSVTGGGVYCAGAIPAGVLMGLSNSQAGISYQLRKDLVNIGDPIIGTGSALNFGRQTEAGSYTVVATTVSNATTATCPRTMTGSVIVTKTELPVLYTVSGGGNRCENGSGLFINLSNSQTGVYYELYRNNAPTGLGVNGNNDRISFGPQTLAGEYTIKATTISSTNPPIAQCMVNMSGSVFINIDPLPVMQSITGGESFCNYADALGATINLAGSQSGVTYELLNPTNNVVATVVGDGTGFTFGNFKEAGIYTIIATATGNCTRTMGTISINPIIPPALQTVSGNRTFCRTADPNGVRISLSGSEANTMYQLMNNGSLVETGIIGANGSVTFDTYLTSSTNYSILATRNTCTTSIPVTGIAEIAPVTNTVTARVTSPVSGEVTFGGSVTYTATSSIAYANPTYRWYVAKLDAPTQEESEYKLQPGSKGSTFTLNPVPAGHLSIMVQVDALSDMCVTEANKTATFRTEPLYPLPVEMLYFTAEKKQNNLVVLEWATAMEKMNEGFQIEVSQDAKNYRTLSFVPTKNGNTNQKQVYSFHDKENGKYGTRYYRIKQLDVDGTSEYFGPKAVNMDELVVEQISAYPNPFTSEINLEVNAEAAGSMHVIVSSAVGAKVLERTINVQKGSNKAQLQLNPNLPLGMYIVTTRLNGKTNHIKLLKK